MNALRMVPLALTAALLVGWSADGSAQLSVRGGNQQLNITTGTAGGQPVAVTNTHTTLSWRRQAVIAKITVVTSCPGQKFSLAVVATNVSSGVAAPQVTLSNGMLATDIIRSIPTGGTLNKSCTLRYTASATFAQGNSTELGTDVHTVTYTLMAQ